MSEKDKAMQTLFRECEKLFSLAGDTMADATLKIFCNTPFTGHFSSPSVVSDEVAMHPALLLQDMFDSPSNEKTCQCFQQIVTIQEHLCWFGSARATGAMYSQILGPDSPYDNSGARAGLFLLPAHFNYDYHVHGADEIYIVISGEASISLQREDFEVKKPGDCTAVPSMTEHALQTKSRPVLLLWSWTGDITLDRYAFTRQ